MTKLKPQYILAILAFFSLIACAEVKTIVWQKDKKENILVGHVNKIDLDQAKLFPWYYYGKRAYQLNDSVCTILKPLTDSLSVLIIAGTWCGDTQIELPKAIKLFEKMNINDSLVEIQLQNRKKQNPFFKAQALQVKAIPCFIFYKKGKEIGRIVEHPEKSFEIDLLSILSNQK
jgi:hypothetical protein